MNVFALPLAALLMLLLVGTSAIAQTCPPPGESESRCIELMENGTNEVPEVQISPGQPTTFRFDSDVAGTTLENREHFEVAPGRRLITLEPSERMRGEKPSALTVCFADGAAPACTTFRLIVHPALGEHRVEIFRHPRPVDSIQAELKKTREENARLHAEIERIRTERDRPEGLIGLFASGMVGAAGIPFHSIKRITERESNTLYPIAVTTFRAPGRVAIALSLQNLDAAKPWTPQGAVLVGSKSKILEATFWPTVPILSGKMNHVWLEVIAPKEQTTGSFILKLWETNGRTFVIGNVTFPELAKDAEK